MKQCAICQKKRNIAWRLVKLRGKYNPTIKRKQKPNLQWVRVPLNVKRKDLKQLAGKRILACTKCIKAFFKQK